MTLAHQWQSHADATLPIDAAQAELEAGMAQSIAAAGVAPKGVRRGRKPGAEVH